MKLRDNIAVSESGFVFNPVNGESFTVNETGAQILNLMSKSKSEDEIKEILISEFNADEVTIEKDLQDFMDNLNRYQLID